MTTMERVLGQRLVMLGLLMGVVAPGRATETVVYYHTDALGSPVAVTDASGNEITSQRSKYEPYGKLLNRPVTDGPGYTGHVSDAATGLSYMQQRYYDPGIGRFLSVDPVTANGNSGANFNRYWYANNNPYRFTDPDGRRSDGVGGHLRDQDKAQGQDLMFASVALEGGENSYNVNEPTIALREYSVSRDMGKASDADRQAVNHMIEKVQGDGQINFKVDRKAGIKIQFDILSNPTREGVGTTFDPSNNFALVHFNPYWGLRIGNLRQPPILMFFHELKHISLMQRGVPIPRLGDSSVDNRYVIPAESAYANYLHVVSRHSHSDGELIRYEIEH